MHTYIQAVVMTSIHKTIAHVSAGATHAEYIHRDAPQATTLRLKKHPPPIPHVSYFE